MVGYSRDGAVVDLAAKMINENLSDYDIVANDFSVKKSSTLSKVC